MRPVRDASELVETLRLRLTQRLAELAPYRDADAIEQLSYQVRWKYASHLLHDVEELAPEDLTLEETRDMLDVFVETAQQEVPLPNSGPRSSRETPANMIPGAIASEADLVTTFLEEPRVPKNFARVPFRRVLNHADYAEFKKKVRSKWIDDGEDFVLDPTVRTRMSFLRLEQILTSEGIERVVFFHPRERELSLEVDVQLIPALPEDGTPHYFPPRGAYLTTPSAEFFAYTGENGRPLRLGGWLASFVRQ